MFTQKQLKTIKKVIKEEELHTASKNEGKSFNHNLILATERLQEIYHNTCVEGDFMAKLNQKNLQGLGKNPSSSKDKENLPRRRNLSRDLNSKSRDMYQMNLPNGKKKSPSPASKTQLEEKTQYLNQIQLLMSENQQLKAKADTNSLPEEFIKKQEILKRRTIDKLKELERDVKKHRIIEETWMKCKESLLEQNKMLAEELKRVQKHQETQQILPKSKPKSRSRDKDSLNKRATSNSQSRSLEKTKCNTHNNNPVFEFRKGSKSSLLSSKWSIGEKQYNSINARSRSRGSVDSKVLKSADDSSFHKDTEADKHASFKGLDKLDESIMYPSNKHLQEKKIYLNTFGKKKDTNTSGDDILKFEYSKSNEDTPDFDTLDRQNHINRSLERKNSIEMRNKDMIILGYQTKCEELTRVNFFL